MDADVLTARPTLSIDRRHCPHCSQFISLKTYKAHKRLYYDSDACVWQTSEVCSNSHSLDLESDVESPPHYERESEETADTFSLSPPVDMGGMYTRNIQFLPYHAIS